MSNRYDDLLRTDTDPQPVASNPYDELVLQGAEADRNALIAASLEVAGQAPEQVAAGLELARDRGVPPAVALSNRDALEAERQRDRMDRLLRESPIVARWASVPENMGLAQDDLENLARLDAVAAANRQYQQDVPFTERVSARIKEGWLGLRAAFEGLLTAEAIKRGAEAGATGDFQMGFDPAGNPIYASEIFLFGDHLEQVTAATEAQGDAAVQALAEGVAPIHAEMAKLPRRPATQALLESKSFGDTWRAFAMDPLGVIVDLGVTSTVQQLPALAVTVATRNPGMAALAAGGNSSALELGNGVVAYLGQQGVDTTDANAIVAALQDDQVAQRAVAYAQTRAGIVGAFDAAAGGLASKVLIPSRVVSSQPARETLNTFVAQPTLQMLLGGTGEATAQLATEGEIRAGEVFAEAAGELFTAPVEAGTFAFDRYRQRATERAANVEQSAVDQARLNAVTEVAASLKTSERSPEAVEALVRQMREAGQEVPEAVYIDAEQARTYFQQQGLDPQKEMADLVGDAGRATEALALGGDLVVPFERWVARVAKSPHKDALQRLARFDPERLSADELANLDIDALLAEVYADPARGDEAAARAQASAADADPVQEVYMDVLGQLLGAGVERSAAEAQAQFLAQRYATRAERRGLGETAMDVYRLSGLSIEREGLGEEVLRQRPAEVDLDLDPVIDALRTGRVPTDQDIYGPSLVSALVAAGGIRPDSMGAADLRAQDAGMRPGLLNRNGMTLDDAVVWAWENGFLDRPPTQMLDAYDAADELGTLLNLIVDELGGRPTFARRNENPDRARLRRAADELGTLLSEAGLPLEDLTNEQVRRFVLEGVRPQVRRVELSDDPEVDGVVYVNDRNGALIGTVVVEDNPEGLQIRGVELSADMRGQGLGVEVYERLAERAFAAGKPLLSDDTEISQDAVRVWEALERRGYAIERGETAEGVPTFRAVAPPEDALGASRGGERVFEQAAPVESSANVDEVTGLPMNDDGTVTVYHHTSADRAESIRRDGLLRADAEPDVYVTTRAETDTGYGDTAVPIRVDPARLELDDEFPNGRRDFRINVGRPGGSIRVRVENDPTAPDSPGAPRVEASRDRPLQGRIEEPQDQTQSEAFRDWFGDSKVVDEDGKPLVVYHGSKSAGFKEFDPSRLGSATGNEGFFGAGFYFTDSESIASGYAGDWDGESGRANTMRVYLSISNPLRLSESERDYEAALAESRRTLLALEGWTEAERAEFMADDIDFISDAISRIGGRRFREVIEANGFDGVHVDGSYGSMNADEWVAFRPEQIKSATDNRGTFDPNDPRIFYQSNRPFFSALTRAVESSKQAKAPAAQWAGLLRNMPGVRQEEIEWSGVLEWLGKQSGSVTREQVVDYLRANELQVEEVVLGTPAAADRNARQRDIIGRLEREFGITAIARLADGVGGVDWITVADDFPVETWPDAAAALRDEWMALYAEEAVQGGPTKYESLRLPGGENYRELLLTLPAADDYHTAWRKWAQARGLSDLDSEAEFQRETGRTANDRQNFTDGHWSVPNVVAHVRFDTRTDADGKKVLFVQELQSDWHQAGRKKGYASQRRSIDEIEADRSRLNRERSAVMDEAAALPDSEMARFRSLMAREAELRAELMAVEEEWTQAVGTSNSVPDAPFKTSWPELVMKRMVRYAAENGFDRIAWPTPDLVPQIEGWGTNLEQIKSDQSLSKRFGAIIDRYARDLPRTAKGLAKRLGGKLVATEIDTGSSAGTIELPAIEITPEMREAVMAGLPLFQRGGGGRRPVDVQRGRIEFRSDGSARIVLTKDANLSTFLHETGHLWLDELIVDATTAGTDPQLAADLDRVLAWMGVEARAADGRDAILRAIGTEHHESWARGFEAYLREGRAPSPALRDIFARFRAWLVRLYKDITQLRVELSPEVREVMGRLIATDDEIAAAEAQDSFVALAASEAEAAELGMSPDEFRAYVEARERATAEAREQVEQDLLAAWEREAKAEYQAELQRMREAVEEEVNAEPVYRAMLELQRKDGPKLNKAELVDRYGAAFLARLPGPGGNRANRGPYIYTLSGGLGLDEAGFLFGFNSGDALVQALVNAKSRKDTIEALARERMAQFYPDPLLDGSLAERAQKAVHAGARMDVLDRELRVLARKAGVRPTQARVIAEVARQMIGRRQVRELRPREFLVAERRAAREALQAVSARQFPVAHRAKFRQVLNARLYAEALAAQERVEKDRRYLQRFDKKSKREALGKAGNGYLEQIDLILDQLDLRRISGAEIDRNAALRQMDEAIADGRLVVPPDVRARVEAARRTNWRELTVDELGAMVDAVRQIDTLARRELEIVLEGERRQLEADALEVADSVLLNGDYVAPALGTKSGRERIARWGKEALAVWLRPSAIARMADGGKDRGPVTRLIIEPLRRAVTERLEPMKVQAQKDLAELYQRFYSRAELVRMSRFRERLPEIGQHWTRFDLLSLALNWGNAGNRQAVLESVANGQQLFTEAGVQQALRRLSGRDWEFVQAVWDYIDGYWPQIAEAQRRRTGLAPEKVEAAPFTIRTADGQEIEVRGGYYPLVYDRDTDANTKLDDLEDAFKRIMNGRNAKAATARGHTIERVGSGRRPVRFGINVLHSHLNQVIHDLALGDAVDYVYKVLNYGNVKAAFSQVGKLEDWKALNIWLKDAAAGELAARNVLDMGFRWLRLGFTKSKLGFNIITALLQPTGFLQSAVVVGKANMIRGLMGFLASPVATYRQVMEASAFMRARYELNAWNKDVQDSMDALRGKFGLVPSWVGPAMFLMITQTQKAVDVTTWLAAYRRGLDEYGGDDAQAVLYADGVVENAQTSGFFSDRSAIERGSLSDTARQSEFVRSWTTLISYMLAKGNIAFERVKSTNYRSIPQVANLAADLALLFSFEPMLVALIRGAWPDEDEDWWWWLAAETAGSVASTIPFVREVPSGLKGFEVTGTPQAAFLNDIGKAATQIQQGEVDAALLKSANNVGGTLFHYPSAQMNRAIDAYWREEVEGEDVAPYEYITGRRDRQ